MTTQDTSIALLESQLHEAQHQLYLDSETIAHLHADAVWTIRGCIQQLEHSQFFVTSSASLEGQRSAAIDLQIELCKQFLIRHGEQPEITQ